MNERTLRIRIGIFVLAALGLLFALVWMFGDLPTGWGAGNRFVVNLPNAERVSVGTPVRRSGVRIGEVRTIDLDDETGKVRLTIEVPRRYSLRKHERPVLTRTLLGDSAIDFVPRPLKPGEEPDRSAVEPGAELEGSMQMDIPASLTELHRAAENFNKMAAQLERTVGEAQVAVGNWGRVGERIETLLKTGLEEKLVKTIDNANATLSSLNEVLSPQNQKNFNATLKNVRDASDNLDSLTRNADELFKEGRQTLKQVNASLGNIDKITRPLAERSESLTKNLDESAVQLNRLLSDLREILNVFARSDGTVQRLLNDPALYNNLNSVACGLVKMMPQIERILRDVEIFADKIARHPESLGVGGVVRPGSGIK